jgi:hypothetical protein
VAVPCGRRAHFGGISFEPRTPENDSLIWI